MGHLWGNCVALLVGILVVKRQKIVPDLFPQVEMVHPGPPTNSMGGPRKAPEHKGRSTWSTWSMQKWVVRMREEIILFF